MRFFILFSVKSVILCKILYNAVGEQKAATYHEEYVQFHKEHGMTVEEADIRAELIKEQNL